MKDYTAVIQAGGKGTRLLELTGDRLPKPMLPLNGKPMLEWQIENIVRYGIREFVIIIGHLGDLIQSYFGDGSRFGVHIRYIAEHEPLGSAGALFYLKPLLRTGQFLLVFGDVMFDVDLGRMLAFHESRGGQATLLVHPNAHPYDSDILTLDGNACVTGILPKGVPREDWYENCVNAGIYALSSAVLTEFPEARRMDLEREVLLPLMKRGAVCGYHTPEYVKDAGTPERFRRAEQEQRDGVWKRKNLENKQACMFLDRDGTINRFRGLISTEEVFELENGAAEAIRKLNEAGYLAIVVTNQPVVARGLCGMEDVKRIHRKMQTLLGERGAYLDDIVFCPHHPDKGYPEENPAYKIPCTCRKPGTGMIDRMIEKYNIDPARSYMVGDSTVDVQTGKNAGLKTVLLRTGQAGQDGKYAAVPDFTVENLGEAVERILSAKEAAQ